MRVLQPITRERVLDRRLCTAILSIVCSVLLAAPAVAQPAQQPQQQSSPQQQRQERRGAVADKPLFRDPVFDGAADPVVVWNHAEREWWMFYTNRRAKLADEKIDGVNWVHGTKIGIARSRNGAQWEYVGTANLPHEAAEATFWAPEVIFGNGRYHMYVTVVPGIFRDWRHPRSIAHYTSRNLKDWEYQSTLKLASDKVIDACVLQMPEGGWRMWYNNEADHKSIYYADSDDLNHWTDRGKVALPGNTPGEGPKVFRFGDAYWMVVDVWDGLALYRSADTLKWQRQVGNLLQQPGQGADDGAIGHHADVVVMRDRAYLFYFTHPGRASGEQRSGYDARRSSIQVTELIEQDGKLQCDRDAPTYINLRFRFRAQIHDPSTILLRDGKYWSFSTGMGVQVLSSEDLRQWRLVGRLFDEPADWVYEVVPQQRGHFWAPDVIEVDGVYRVYYSVSAFGKRTSAIALATSRVLDPTDKDYGWTDHGIVVQTDENSDHNAIDPGVVRTPDGELWLVFGSYWSGIKLIQLDPKSGKRIAPDSPVYSLAWNEAIEAPAILFHDGYYYLFVNWGRCCIGVRSTYNIRVGRSRTITGPYLDRDGVDMLKGGGTLLLDSEGPAIGPGHAAFFKQDGQRLLSYHYYSAEHRGRAELGIRRLCWDNEGWPEVDKAMAYQGAIVDDNVEDD